ncbi:EAL domain-containing protein [Solimonas marina]|uniref:EAL domain-containing response regulator n=1 Tax=Solimonas marina TaxID=2714601 RepID=A0A970B5Z2_9GAMM|nr:EAL domain-containing response regulator [Solimonas marina]NKF22238.1 EAL domain-containing response regulator [Solimonas marina]
MSARILCVEDEADLRADLADELRDAGYEVLEVADGRAALDALPQFAPDLVLCDINMPRMDGLAVLEAVRARGDRLAAVPFVLLTAYGEKHQILRGRALGADDYVVKPADFDLLISTIRTRLASVSRTRQQLQLRSNGSHDTTQRPLPELPDADDLRARLPALQARGYTLLLGAAQDRPMADDAQRLAERSTSLHHVREWVDSLAPGAEWFGTNRRCIAAVWPDPELQPLLSEWLSQPLRRGEWSLPPVLVVSAHEPGSNVLDELAEAEYALSLSLVRAGPQCTTVDAVRRKELRAMRFIEKQLPSAIARDALELYFQPKYALSEPRIVGAEALLRWTDPSLGSISPALFVPTAERCGLIGELGDWVLRHAIWALARLRSHGIDLRIAVNISAIQLRDELPAHVEQLLKEASVEPKWLEIEITETALLGDLPHAAAIARRLRALGIKLTVDDFGSGHAGFGYLRELPLDALKLDRSFVAELETNEADRRITESILGLARSLGLETVAEGVECEAQRSLLRSLGCDAIQGYLAARPMPLSALIERLQP